MRKTIDIFKSIKILLMAFSVVFMLTACNGNDADNVAQSPLANGNGEVSQNDPAQLSAENSKCWQTGVISILYKGMGEVALDTYRKMTGGAKALMMVAFAIWMAMRLTKHLGSFKEETMGEVWTEIAKMFFLCLVCGIIASEVNLLAFVLGDFIFPIYNAFLELASALLTQAANVGGASNTVTVFEGSKYLEQTITIDTGFSCKVGSVVTIDATSSTFPSGPKEMMECMVCKLNSALSFGMLAAYQIMGASGFTGWIVGLFVLLCFLFVKLGFVFYLIDTIFRFTVMVVMLPLMIMGYPFKATRGLLSQGIANMLNSAGFMMFFSIIIAVCTLALSTILQNLKFGEDASFASFSVPFVCIMMVGFLVISSIKIAGKLCDSIVGGSSNSEFQKSAKALIVGAIKFVASGGAKIATSLMPNTVEKMANFKNKVAGRYSKITGK